MPLRQERDAAKELKLRRDKTTKKTGAERVQGSKTYLQDACFEGRDFRKKLKKCSGLWRLKGKIVVPAGNQLCRSVSEACHDSAMSGHVGITTMHDLVARHFYWKLMRKDVEEYMKHCDACQKIRPLLRLMLVSSNSYLSQGGEGNTSLWT
jgi:hypothetical protein